MLPASGIGWSTFGENHEGELYVARIETGTLHKILSQCASLVASFEVDGNELTAIEGEQYQWFLNGIEIPGATDQEYTVTQSGAYSVTITNEEGCESTSEQVGVIYSSIEENLLVQDISLHPNPFDVFVNTQITFHGQVNVQLTLLNGLGQKIWSNHYNNVAVIKENLDFSGFQSGIYTLRVDVGENHLLRKLIKY